MADKKTTLPVTSPTGRVYQIEVRGHLADHWSDWLGGMAISQDARGHTLLTGIVPDQAALHGILAQIRDLGLTLIAVTSQDPDGEEQ
jgi:hypothetical protein